MPNLVTKGKVVAGQVAAAGNISSSSAISAQSLTGTQAVSSASAVVAPTFTSASVGMQMLRFAVSAGTTGVQTSTATIPAGCVIEDVYLHVKTLETSAGTKQISIGNNTSASAFLVKVSTASAGVFNGSVASGSLSRGLGLSEQTSTASTFAPKTFVVNTPINITTQAEAAHTQLVADVVVSIVRVSGL